MGSMDDTLDATARQVLAAAPCSIEMPAGTGKTHLLAAAAAEAASRGARSLILTHTNAGVDAIRRRLALFKVPSSLTRVETITSWAFSLARAYSRIAGVTVPEVPDWTQSTQYVLGAARVAQSRVLQRVNSVSFDYFFIDEYQDCTVDQHGFILALAQAIPQAVILGDRLQAIFGFAGPLARWDEDVLPGFPVLDVEPQPHRWSGHNPALGQWLLHIRPLMVHGGRFDFSAHSVEGLKWVLASPTAVMFTARNFGHATESVVLLDTFADRVAAHASKIGGGFTVMEEVEGRFMKEWLSKLPAEGDPTLAHWLAEFTKECFVGHSGLDRPLIARLKCGQTVQHYRRPGLEGVLRSFDELLAEPTYERLCQAGQVIRQTPALRVYRREAWMDTFSAVASSVETGAALLDSLAHVRDRLRRRGRGPATRIASRTVLVKGLEYDHVIIADVNKMTDPRNLYVALTRARKSITVIGRSPTITLRDD